VAEVPATLVDASLTLRDLRG